MPVKFGVLRIQDELEELRFNLDAIDIDKVKQETVRSTAMVMNSMVRQTLVAEERLNIPATKGPYESGPGPSMADKDAWIVEPVGDSEYTVRPHPQVKQRAYVLNYGYSGPITPNSADALRFTINGIPVYRDSVPGPEPTNYWQAALTRMEKSGKFERIGERELRKEIEEQF